ncbi:MAG: hypothetical protein MI785_24260 [Kiloniellales bacterium]|nr:hypothetical protein [Kiloniellales bacterium]
MPGARIGRAEAEGAGSAAGRQPPVCRAIRRPLVVVANEVSGSTTIYEVRSGRPIVLLDGRRVDDVAGRRPD